MRVAVVLVAVLAAFAVSAVEDQTDPRQAETGGAALPDAGCVRAMRQARIFWEAGDRQQAIELLDEAVGSCAAGVDPIMARLDLHRLAGDDEAVAEDLKALRQRLADPEQELPTAAFTRAVADSRASEEELELIRLRLERDAASGAARPRVLRALAVAQSRAGLIRAARTTITRLLETEPSPEVRWAAVKLDLQLESWDDAIVQLEKLRDEDEELGYSARLRLVWVYGAAGRADDAVREAIALYGSEGGPRAQVIRKLAVTSLLNAAWLMRDRGEVEQARGVFEQVLEIDADNQEAQAAVRLLYGSAAERIAHTQQQEQALMEESDPLALLEQGTQRLAVGDAAGAFELLRRAAPALQDHEIAWYNLGIAATKVERWQDAADALSRALELDPDNAGTALNLGIALEKLGRCERAIKVLEALVADRPEQYQAHYFLYSCFRALGDAERAAEALRRYNAGRD